MCDLIEILILQIRNMKLSSQAIELGCPEPDMSLWRSHMKLRPMGVFNTPPKNEQGELVYGRFSKK